MHVLAAHGVLPHRNMAPEIVEIHAAGQLCDEPGQFLFDRHSLTIANRRASTSDKRSIAQTAVHIPPEQPKPVGTHHPIDHWKVRSKLTENQIGRRSRLRSGKKTIFAFISQLGPTAIGSSPMALSKSISQYASTLVPR